MKAFDLHSEQYQPTGGISSEGVQNQLGRPRLDRLTLLVREAVQNSWDARTTASGPMEFGIAGWVLTKEQRALLRSTVFRNCPDNLDTQRVLSGSTPATALALFDRGTWGLCGPTRADAPAQKGVPSNFVNLLRNVGQPPQRVGGGGTYGFGKTAYFLASEVRTIITHSKIQVGRGFEERFMAAALGPNYTQTGRLGRHKRLTGRHWWGRAARDGVADPLTGRDVARVSLALGLPLFTASTTGTTIILLNPAFDDKAPEAAMRMMADAILQSFWPKMVDGPNGRASIRFSLSWNGARIPIQHPDDVPPLDGFVRAFRNLQAHIKGKAVPHEPSWIVPVECHKPIRNLGFLSLTKFPPTPRLQSHGAGEEQKDSPFGGSSRHAALLRAPKFVVRYFEGPAIPYDLAEYAGVFVASEAAEAAFARSEPPTHDDWSPDMLEDRHERTFVRVAFRRMREAMEEFTGTPSVDRSAGIDVPLGAFSDMLGGMIPAERGTGARFVPPPATRESAGGGATGGATGGGSGGTESGSRRGGARIRVLDPPRPELIGGRPAIVLRFDLEPEQRDSAVRVRAAASVLLDDDSTELDPPVGAERPSILRWKSTTGGEQTGGEEYTIPKNGRGPWSLAVSMPSDATVAIDLVVEPAL